MLVAFILTFAEIFLDLVLLFPPTSLLNLGLVSKYWQSVVNGFVAVGCERAHAYIKFPKKKEPLRPLLELGLGEDDRDEMMTMMQRLLELERGKKSQDAFDMGMDVEPEYEHAPYGSRLPV
jgi:hypothetical protein